MYPPAQPALFFLCSERYRRSLVHQVFRRPQQETLSSAGLGHKIIVRTMANILRTCLLGDDVNLPDPCSKMTNE